MGTWEISPGRGEAYSQHNYSQVGISENKEPKKYHPHPLESTGFFLNPLEYVDFWGVGVVRCGFPKVPESSYYLEEQRSYVPHPP